MPEGSERRAMRRYKVSMPFILETEKQDQTVLQRHGVTSDVSLRGLGFSVENPAGIQIGMPLEVNLFHVIGESPIRAKAEVCWLTVGEDDPDSAKVGVKLTGIPSRVHYERWLEVLAMASDSYETPSIRVANS